MKLLILLFIPLFGLVQPPIEWEKTYGTVGNEFSVEVQQTSDGGYIVGANVQNDLLDSFDDDMLLIKTDASGIEEWSQIYESGSDGDILSSVKQTIDGGYIIAGSKLTTTALRHIFIIKTDASGVEEWSQSYGETNTSRALDIIQTIDGGYVFLASGSSGPGSPSDIYLIKIDGSGVEEWSQVYGGLGSQNPYAIKQATDGGFIIVGQTQSSLGSDGDVYLIKTNASGVEQWSQTYGGVENDAGRSLDLTIDGGYIIGGYTKSFGPDFNAFMIKTDASGVEEWTQIYGGDTLSLGSSVIQVSDGGYLFGYNTFLGGVSSWDFNILKTDSSGTEEWSHIFSGTGHPAEDEQVNSIQETSDGGFVVCGFTESVDLFGDDDVYLIKIANCNTESIDIHTACNNYTWIDGVTYTSSNNTAQWIIENSLGCDSIITLDLTIDPLLFGGITDCIDGIHIPTGFSPNNNQNNDTYNIIVGQNVQAILFSLYDRWGNTILTTTDKKFEWDGTLNGVPLNSGVYPYILEAVYVNGETEILSGNVKLIK